MINTYHQISKLIKQGKFNEFTKTIDEDNSINYKINLPDKIDVTFIFLSSLLLISEKELIMSIEYQIDCANKISNIMIKTYRTQDDNSVCKLFPNTSPEGTLLGHGFIHNLKILNLADSLKHIKKVIRILKKQGMSDAVIKEIKQHFPQDYASGLSSHALNLVTVGFFRHGLRPCGMGNSKLASDLSPIATQYILPN